VGFDEDECRRIGVAARDRGLGIRVHADQTGHAGGARLAVELDAASADHLEHVGPDDADLLAASRTVGILLPGVTYHLLEISPGLPRSVRSLVDRGVCLALATDYNPGSSPTLSMQAVMQLAARLYRLSYAAVWQMSTINAALALDRGHDRGSLLPGKLADVVVWDVPEHGMVVNRFGTNLVHTVLRRGEIVTPARPDPLPVRRAVHADALS
jgi:imidazolonepropionase